MKYNDDEMDAYNTGYRDAVDHVFYGINPPDRDYYGRTEYAYKQGLSDGYAGT